MAGSRSRVARRSLGTWRAAGAAHGRRRADDDPGRCVQLALGAAAGAVTTINAVLLSAFENGMLGDDGAQIEDTNQIGELLDLDDPAGAVGYAVIIAADCHDAI